jgi:prolipoprotein diacylglyceryl transferase
VPKFTWDIDPALYRIGSFEIRYYSLIFVLVFLGGYALLNWQIRRGGGDEEEAGDFILYGVLGVLLGARFGHVLFYDLDKALADPLWVLKIWTGGLASHGAVIGLIVAMYLFTKRRGVPFLEGADRFVFSGALGASLVRIGNFFNSEIVGKATDGSWGVRFPRYDGRDEPPLRHPSQLYEAAIGLLILGILYLADKKMGEEKRPRGALISMFFVFYFALRFSVEFVKEYQGIDENWPLSMGQILSIPGFLIGVYGIVWSFKHKVPSGWADRDELDEEEEDEDEDRDADDEEDDEAEDVEREASTIRSKSYDPDVEAEFASRKQGGAKRESPTARRRKKRKAKKQKAAAAERESDQDEPAEPEASKEPEADTDPEPR